MPRAVWTGALSFGLVSIPVALYPATQPKDVRFHLFDRHGRRVRYRRFAEEPTPSPARIDVADEPSPEGSRFESHAGATEASEEHRGDELAPSRPLGYDELVHGYEVEPGRFAMLEQRGDRAGATIAELHD